MFIHVFVCDIGDNTNVKLTGIHTVLCPAMRGRFQDNVGQACLYHSGKITLDIMRVWGGDVESCIQHFIANHRIDRGYHPSFDSRREQDLINQICRCRFAIRASDAQNCQLATGPVVKRGSDPRQRATRVFESECKASCQLALRILISHNSDRAIVNRVLNVIVSIHTATFQRDKEMAGFNCAAINGDSCDGNIGNICHTKRQWQFREDVLK